MSGISCASILADDKFVSMQILGAGWTGFAREPLGLGRAVLRENVRSDNVRTCIERHAAQTHGSLTVDRAGCGNDRSSIRFVRFSYDGKFLAIGMEDPNLIVVDVDSGEQVVSLQLQNNLQYLSWHPSKNLLAYVGDKASSEKNSSRDGVIKMIELKE